MLSLAVLANVNANMFLLDLLHLFKLQEFHKKNMLKNSYILTNKVVFRGYENVVSSSGAASPIVWGWVKNFGGAKCLILGEQQYFSLERRFSKHKMTKNAKNVGRHGPLATPMVSYVFNCYCLQKKET